MSFSKKIHTSFPALVIMTSVFRSLQIKSSLTLKGGWLLVANYSIEENPAPINYVNIATYFTGEHQNGMVLDTAELVTINKWAPITEIRFQCYKPAPGRMAHFKNNIENQWGRRLVDYVVQNNGSYSKRCTDYINECADFGSSLIPLNGDTSLLSSQPTQIGWPTFAGQRLYDHAIFKPGDFHIILVDGRYDCDDNSFGGPGQAGSWWRVYVR